jgi:hypothetical protein
MQQVRAAAAANAADANAADANADAGTPSHIRLTHN